MASEIILASANILRSGTALIDHSSILGDTFVVKITELPLSRYYLFLGLSLLENIYN